MIISETESSQSPCRAPDKNKDGVGAMGTTFILHSPSSYPQPPNLCTEAVIDRVMITCMLAH